MGTIFSEKIILPLHGTEVVYQERYYEMREEIREGNYFDYKWIHSSADRWKFVVSLKAVKLLVLKKIKKLKGAKVNLENLSLGYFAKPNIPLSIVEDAFKSINKDLGYPVFISNSDDSFGFEEKNLPVLVEKIMQKVKK